MTIQECYEAIGGNYEDVLRRLRSEALIRKFTLKFLEDQSYPLLKQALGDNNYEEAFRGAHTLKGVCQNLSFDRLYEVSSELTELLRDRTGEKQQKNMRQQLKKLRSCRSNLLQLLF